MSTDFLQEVPSDLRYKIEKIASILPDSIELFQEIYDFALNKGENLQRKKATISKELEAVNIEDSNIIFKLENASILSPIRKKLDFVFHLNSNDKQPMISLLKNSKIEYSINNLKTNIKMATFLPVPEKSNIVYLYLECKSVKDPTQQESILMALNKTSTLGQFIKMGILPNNEKDFKKCKDYMRKQAILTGFRIIDPFSNNGTNTTSSNNDNIQGQLKSFHVECHRGTKEGTLYFLPDHILFGFKKPILVFQSTDIASITYSSITRLTFNMTLITNNDEKFEFSMIDQSEYAKIDEYVKTKQVIDKSMSEELKAKKLKSSQQTAGNSEENSALKDAVAEMNDTATDATNINNLAGDSDDEENDQDFQAESDLSDGSENGEEDEEDDDDEEDNIEGEQAEEDEDAEEEAEEDMPRAHDSVEVTEDIPSDPNLQLNYPSTAVSNEQNQPNVGSLEDIIVDLDDEDEDDEDDSGVEYD
ncbi:hypothetical protein C6P45_002912 [Maudiozyma exigua]|uniref:Histone chaperone RTT106 n=1 Tax=Maudiozyma exigua TaxID=34358 RepID=A0A9P7B305_MAUEX|nr:hypothetical protein C6P45_002912 [Kazachstania exigua]